MGIRQLLFKANYLLWLYMSMGMAFCCCASDSMNETEILIRNAPEVRGDLYKCKDMVRVVNHLRSLGKHGAIKALQEHLRQHKLDIRVHLICRCLFDCKKCWNPPAIGGTSPEVSRDAMKSFPSFPLAISGRVPFLLVQGYKLGGLPEDPAKCLRLCESLPLIASDLPTEGYEAAARSLVASKDFEDLYPDAKVRKKMAEMIIKQAADDNEQRHEDKKDDGKEQQNQQSLPRVKAGVRGTEFGGVRGTRTDMSSWVQSALSH